MSVPPQGEGQGPELGLDPGAEPSLQSPLEDQQQRKLFNSQSTYENERIDDGGDDQVGGWVDGCSHFDQPHNADFVAFLPPFLCLFDWYIFVCLIVITSLGLWHKCMLFIVIPID